ncbi:MAG TPA: galactose oxidase early set domain-containing protein, partial [Acidimicrobiia bacterium]|nr:galactose oxidase early set domain-containing protein [Acidimicrobiia bacterium]
GAAQARPDRPPDTVGRWTPPFEEPGPGAPSPVEAAVLPDGRVLYLAGAEGGDVPAVPTGGRSGTPSGTGPVRLLDLRSGTPEWTTPDQRGADLSASDLTALPDGRLLLAGGPRAAAVYDPRTRTLAPTAPTRAERWYPQLVVGGDGSATVFGGVARLTGGGPPGPARWTETYRADRGTWQDNDAGPGSENDLPPDPRLVFAPNGKFFFAAAGQLGGPSAPSPGQAGAGLYQFFDPRTKTWQVAGAAPLGARSGAFVVPLTIDPPYDRLTLLTGGGTVGPAPGAAAVTATTLTALDADGDVAAKSTADLAHARWAASGVLLPDGQVLAVGGADRDDTAAPGTARAVRTPELYDPAAGKWTAMADHKRDRAGRSSALLLPDMRVLLGGGDGDPSFEVWSPPYLFRGPRPVIKQVQRAVSYGESFDITTPDADLVESVVLLRTPSPAYGTDSDQRALRLEFSHSDMDTLTATAPPSGTAAPPGLYYLVVNEKSLQGPVPSVARLVAVGRTDVGDALQPFADDAPAPVGP